MRLCRFNDNQLGVVKDDLVHDVTSVPLKFFDIRGPFQAF